MHIVPYYIVEQTTDPLTYTAWIFMKNGGKTSWETDEKGKVTTKFIVDNYLTPNGFVGSLNCVKGDYMYFEVDPAAMKLTDFYKWTDFLRDGRSPPSDLDIWRPFIWVANDQAWASEIQYDFLKDFWGLSIV